jgi:hypothetical protein
MVVLSDSLAILKWLRGLSSGYAATLMKAIARRLAALSIRR